MQILLPYQWEMFTQEEKISHYEELGKRVLEHRYRYYVLDAPILEDYIYDHLEKSYELVASNLNLPPVSDMVGFDESKPGAKEAAERVINNQDYHSKWLEEMKPIWDRLGKPDCYEKY